MITTIVNLLTFGILFSSIISITSNNPIISIIFLITAFVNAAGYLILLGINFIGISYIVIYVGAIAVLFLFIILMINIKLTDILDTGYNFTKNLPIGLNIASLLLFIFFSVASQPLTEGMRSNPASSGTPAEAGLVGHSDLATYLFSLFPLANHERDSLPALPLVRDLPSAGGHISDIHLLEFTQIEVLGQFLYTYASVFLIILSLILLLAMLAIIIISKKNVTNI
jgi:NADH-ubiquinone oxidoreductase chain 6